MPAASYVASTGIGAVHVAHHHVGAQLQLDIMPAAAVGADQIVIRLQPPAQRAA
ncbi:MAG: hypothetical protein R3A10_05165 [Caldilineaceae bacterium]